MIKQEYNLYSDFCRVSEINDSEVSIKLINRPLIHPNVTVIGNSFPKKNDDGIVIYVGRYKKPFFIPFNFNYGTGNFSTTNEGSENVQIDYSIDRSNWVNKADFINFSTLKYVQNYRTERDINWCNPQFASIIKNVVIAWEEYCDNGRRQNSNNKNVNKIYPILLLGYMSRKDGKLDSSGHMLGTPSKGFGHKSGTAIDMNFENDYDHYDNVDDYIIQAVQQFFSICKNKGIKGIGYYIKDKYRDRVNDLYVPLSDHKNHFHVSATERGQASL